MNSINTVGALMEKMASKSGFEEVRKIPVYIGSSAIRSAEQALRAADGALRVALKPYTNKKDRKAAVEIAEVAIGHARNLVITASVGAKNARRRAAIKLTASRKLPITRRGPGRPRKED